MQLVYVKLPNDITTRWVLLMDPMLATGGSAARAIQVLTEHGVPEKRIICVNIFASPEGVREVYRLYPDVKIVTSL